MSNETFFLDYHIKIIKILVRYGGMSIQSKSRNLKDTIKDRCLFILNIFWLNFDAFGAVVWLVDGLANSKSITDLSRVGPCVVFSFVANIKGYFYIRHEDKINDLIDGLKKLEKKVNVTRKSYGEENIIREETKFLAIIIKTLNVINVILLTTFALSPLILIAYNYTKTNEIHLILPFLVIYPFDWKDIRIWPFVYLHQIWSECVGVLNVCVSDYFFYICCTFIKVQFHLLQHRLEHITFKSSAHIRTDLIECIKWHQELIRLSSVLEMVYTTATLYNFLCSSMMICLTGFSVMAMEDMAFGITFFVFLASNLMQIFLLCFFGNMLMRSSMEVGDAIYKSKWYQTDSDISKIILIMLTRAQKPCKLTASDFADVNLLAFTKILSTAWSYFALLNTMYSSGRT